MLIAALVASAALDARADSLRCGDRIVATGDSSYTVRSVCGEPRDQQHRVEVRTVRRRLTVPCVGAKAPHRRCDRIVETTTEVQIDEWTYDFGPYRFVQYLTFIDDRLTTVVSGGRGRRRSP